MKVKSSIWEMVNPLGKLMCRDAMYMIKIRGEMGTPWGTSTETGEKVRGESWKARCQVRSWRKDYSH